MGMELSKRGTSRPEEILGSYTAEQQAVIGHLAETIENQLTDEDVKAAPDVVDLLERCHRVLREQRAALEALRQTMQGGDGLLKEALTKISGSFVGIYDKLRRDPISKLLRDNCTALNFASTGYSMLHAAAVACGEREAADVAGSHLKQLSPLVVEFSTMIPEVVVEELAQRGVPVDADAVSTSLEEIKEAWSPRHTQQHVQHAPRSH